MSIGFPPHPPPPLSSSSSLSLDGRFRRPSFFHLFSLLCKYNSKRLFQKRKKRKEKKPWRASSPVCERSCGGRPFVVWSSYKTTLYDRGGNVSTERKRREAHITDTSLLEPIAWSLVSVLSVLDSCAMVTRSTVPIHKRTSSREESQGRWEEWAFTHSTQKGKWTYKGVRRRGGRSRAVSLRCLSSIVITFLSARTTKSHRRKVCKRTWEWRPFPAQKVQNRLENSGLWVMGPLNLFALRRWGIKMSINYKV